MNAKKLLAMEEAERVAWIMGRCEELKEARQERIQTAQRLELMYRGVVAPAGKGKSNVHVPLPKSQVETVVPRLVGEFIGLSQPPFRAVGREPSDQANARSAEQLTFARLQLDEAFFKLDGLSRQAVKFGSGPYQNVYQYRNGTSRRQPLQIMGITIPGLFSRQNGQAPRGAPTLIPLQYQNVWPDPSAESSLNFYDVCVRFWLREDQVEELAKPGPTGKPVFKNVEKLNYALEAPPIGQGPDLQTSVNRPPPSSRYVKYVELWRYEIDEVFVVVAPQQRVELMAIENPYDHGKKTVGFISFQPQEAGVDGLSLLESIEVLCLELDAKRRQRLDLINLLVTPWFKKRLGTPMRGAGKDGLALYPGKVIEVADPERDLVPGVVANTTGPTYFEEDRIMLNVMQATGVNDWIQGTSSTKMEMTATEADIKLKQSVTRFVYNFKIMSHLGLGQIARRFLQLDQQLMAAEEVVRLIGEEGIHFEKKSREEIQGEFDIYIVVDPLRDDERVFRSQLLNLAQVWKDRPYFNQMAVDKKLARLFHLEPGETFDFTRIPGAIPGQEPTFWNAMSGSRPPELGTGGAGGAPGRVPGINAPQVPLPRDELAGLLGVTQPGSATPMTMEPAG